MTPEQAAAAVLAAGVVGYALLVEPVWGRIYMRRLRAGGVDEAARIGAYRLTIATGWTTAAVALAAFALSGLPPSAAFLALPHDTGAVPVPAASGIVIGMLAGLGAGAVAAAVGARRSTAPPVAGDIDVLVPRTARQRRWYAGVAVTAGICEEVVYRGAVLTVAALLLPDAPPWALAVGAGVAFGVAHLYQGPVGVAATSVLGIVVSLCVVATGSLLPAMVLHVLVDLRVLLLPVPDGGGARVTAGHRRGGAGCDDAAEPPRRGDH